MARSAEVPRTAKPAPTPRSARIALVVRSARIALVPRTARIALAAAVGLLALLCAEWYLVFHVGAVQRVDASVYYGFLGLSGHPHVTALASRIASLCNPVPYVFLAALPLAVALLRRRPLTAGAICVILAGANLTTHVLKPLLTAPRPDGLPISVIGPGSWPSGHATASMSLALCAMLAAPPRLRPLVAALGAAFAIAVCYSFLTLGWHYPSDAVAGLLVASIWALIAIAGASIVDGRRPERLRSGAGAGISGALTPSAVAVGAVFVVGAVVLALHPQAAGDYLRAHRWFVAGAIALAVAGISLPAGVMIALRR